MSFPFRDRSRLSDRYRGKTADELLNELKSDLDKDRKMFFETPFTRSGFPFDDNMSRGRQDIRSHLEDLAHRHPEFADQLRCPPWGGEMGPSQGTRSRGRQGSCEDEGTSFCEPGDQEGVEEPGPLRGRARQNNLPQHGLRNTVDLGKQQEAEQEKTGRGQRSMSAPPDNRTTDQPQRFVSRIDINPLTPGMCNSGEGKPPVVPKQQPSPPKQTSKPAQQGASNVRHIPIFVEGRDEPVITRNVDSAPEKIFTERAMPTQSSFPSERVVPPQAPFVEKVIPTQTAFPSERGVRPQSPFTERVIPTQTIPPQSSFGFTRPSHFTSQHQFQPPQPSTVHNGKSFSKQQQQPPSEEPQPKAQPQPPKSAPEAHDPLSRVQAVERDVEELSGKVQSYCGNSRRDKDYIYLDEMLTRNLLKLDDIETEGNENVRQARRSVIRNIQRCIGDLESKVPTPEESMEVANDIQPEQQVEVTGSSSPVCSSEPATTEVPEQPAVLESNVLNVEVTQQANELMNVEDKPAEMAVIQQDVERTAQASDPVSECVQPQCVEMTEVTSEQQGVSSGDGHVQGESALSELARGNGDDASSERNMEVDSSDVKSELVTSVNTEQGTGEQPPTKPKKGGKKAAAKSKNTISQASS